MMVGTTRRIHSYVATNGKLETRNGATVKSVRTSAKELAERLGVSVRTVYRHRNEMVLAGVLCITGNHLDQLWTIQVKIPDNYPSEKGILTQRKSLSGMGISTTSVTGTRDNKCTNIRKYEKVYQKCGVVNTYSVHRRMCNIGVVLHKRLCNIGVKMLTHVKHMWGKIVKVMERSKAPSLPANVQAIETTELVFPLKRVSVQASAIWYWAVRRWTKHGLDLRLNASNFALMAKKYSRSLMPVFEKDWDAHVKYIEWYLASSDKFTRETTKYGFDFMISASCLNKYLAEQDADSNIIDNDEDRLKASGVWIRDEI